ncbi:hypothetical protein [Bradyrhizobium sp. LA2.1]|uniref:hypothetical protein n=1 Tax=Bradyrhizobium sp. LA2.1 TaxID=3156376 RepID=UPI00339643BC
MMIFDFITQDEMDDLPDDDPQEAFTQFVEITRRRLAEYLTTLSEDENDWHKRTEAQHGFMNVVVAAAKRFEIQPLAALSVPRATKFDSDVYREFRSDLDHYLTQILLNNSARAKRDSVLLSPEFKSTIRVYVFNLRELVENNKDMDDGKRRDLLKHLTDFESALEKKRLNLLAVTVLAVTLLGTPGALGSSVDVAGKLISNIIRAVGEARVHEDATRRLPSTAPPLAITGPRPSETGSTMDDDIPF